MMLLELLLVMGLFVMVLLVKVLLVMVLLVMMLLVLVLFVMVRLAKVLFFMVLLFMVLFVIVLLVMGLFVMVKMVLALWDKVLIVPILNTNDLCDTLGIICWHFVYWRKTQLHGYVKSHTHQSCYTVPLWSKFSSAVYDLHLFSLWAFSVQLLPCFTLLYW